MDDGIIASRYGRALLKYVLETGGGDKVCAQAEKMEKALLLVPEVKEILDDPEGMPVEVKLKVFRTILGDEPMAPELERFLRLVIRNDRMPEINFILHDFIDMYHKAKGLLYVRLVTAVEPSEESLARIRSMVKEKTGYDAVVNVSVDEEIIGGFVFEIEDYTLDASVKGQLDAIRRQFVENNRRIV